MAKEIWANNAVSVLAADILDSDLSFDVAVGDGALFPAISGGDWFYATLVGNDQVEIVKVTALSSDTFTVTRAQQSTTALEWPQGTEIGNRVTKQTLIDLQTGISEYVTLNYIIDGGGVAITTGIKGDIVVDFNATIVGWTLVADQSGSIVIDVWKDIYGNFPPTIADTIAGSEKPTLSTATKNQDNSLSTWTTGITAGDVLRFNVDSITTVTRVTLAIKVQKA